MPINLQELINKTADPHTLALFAIVEELSLLRKQVEKLDRTISKLNEAPIDVTVPSGGEAR